MLILVWPIMNLNRRVQRGKTFANNEGGKLNKMTATIDKLCAVYKKVIS